MIRAKLEHQQVRQSLASSHTVIALLQSAMQKALQMPSSPVIPHVACRRRCQPGFYCPAEGRRLQRQVVQAQCSIKEAQEAVAAVEKDIKMVKEDSPQTTAGETRSRTRSGRVSFGAQLAPSEERQLSYVGST